MTDPQPTTSPDTSSPDNSTPNRDAGQAWLASPLVLGVGMVALVLVAIGLSSNNNTPIKGQEPKPFEDLKPYQKLLQSARENLKAGFDDACMTDLKKAHQLAPDAPETNGELGAFLCKQRQYREAEPYLARARELDKKSAQVASVYATCLAKLGRNDEAMREIAEASRLAPNDRGILLTAGTLCINSFREDQAVTYLRLLLKLQPRHKEGMRLLAHAESLRGKHKAAAEVLARFLENHPDDGPAHEAFQMALLRSGQSKKLVSFYQDLYKLEPSMQRARLLAKALAYYPEHIALARRVLKEALTKAPNNVDLIVEAAGLEYLFGDYKRCAQLLDRVVTTNKAPLRALLVRALLARVYSDGKTKASQLFIRAQEDDPIRAHLGVISVMRDNRDYDQALSHIGKIRKRIRQPYVHATLSVVAGEVHAEAGNLQKALGAFQQAVQSGIKRAEVFEIYGQCELITGNTEGAVHVFTQGLPGKSKDPNRTRGREQLQLWRAIAQVYAGNLDAAKADLQVVAATPRTHLPFAAYKAAAGHILGEVKAETMRDVGRFHFLGPFFRNDLLLYEAVAFELKGDKAKAIERYQAARKVTVGNEAPGPLIDARLKALAEK